MMFIVNSHIAILSHKVLVIGLVYYVDVLLLHSYRIMYVYTCETFVFYQVEKL